MGIDVQCYPFITAMQISKTVCLGANLGPVSVPGITCRYSVVALLYPVLQLGA